MDELTQRLNFCRRPGCVNLVTNGRYCPTHTFSVAKPAYDKFRNKRAWRDRVRPLQLRHFPICQVALLLTGRNCTAPAEEVHHIDGSWKFSGDWDLFIDSKNLASLCKSHHSEITMTEQKQ